MAYQIKVFAVPLCCGAAVITGFGTDHPTGHVVWYGQEDFDRLVAEFNSTIDDFDNRKGRFAVFAGLPQDQMRPAGAPNNPYYNARRSHLTAYLNTHQVRDWRKILEARGFVETSKFRNTKSSRNVYVFSKTFGG